MQHEQGSIDMLEDIMKNEELRSCFGDETINLATKLILPDTTWVTTMSVSLKKSLLEEIFVLVSMHVLSLS